MRKRFRPYRRQSNGRYHLQDHPTGSHESWSTTDRATAQSHLRIRTTRPQPYTGVEL